MRCEKCYLDPATLNYDCPYPNCPCVPRPKPVYRPPGALLLLGVAVWALIAFVASKLAGVL